MALGVSVGRLEQTQVPGDASDLGNVAGYAVRLHASANIGQMWCAGIAQNRPVCLPKTSYNRMY
jgi:hypothetical protein